MIEVSEEYQTYDVAMNYMVDQLRGTIFSYKQIRDVCNYAPIKEVLNETIEDRNNLLISLGESQYSTMRMDNFGSKSAVKLIQDDQSLLQSMDLLTVIYPLAPELNDLLADFTLSIEHHISRVKVFI